ncbi:hypothetical protein PSECIP111951_04149 [Pseudoalteromonas holothuriae]|uniref:Uncharacterized protein n=1 Tax=Pseudoalteromonas holothuriae TaxID=2963714 RepID=A0ABM9GQH7_9GAMM|nr:hypothetical protein [Pseudoalteromonas sp. CIP111951]CAH9068439.1 hypothetical protein PSECIP111951_04149 [Pseudoalteromonas sp. CIP111951]
MKERLRKAIYVLAATTEKVLSIGDSKEANEQQKFSDGIGLCNVSGKVMSKEELKAEKYETGLYDDY